MSCAARPGAGGAGADTAAGSGAAGSTAAAGNPERAAGGASNGSLGARRSIRKRRATPTQLKGGKLVGICPPPGLGRAAAVSGRQNKPAAAAQRITSAFVGVAWAKREGRWRASARHDGKDHVGYFNDEQEAARAFDVVARRLRPKGQAHGVLSGKHWLHLNFPTAKEEAYAARQGMPSAARKSAVAAMAAAQGFVSAFVGVRWDKQKGRWAAAIWHDGSNHHLGYFDDDQEAARAYDAAARRLRPKGKAHGGAGVHWQRVNFPTAAEKAFAKGKGMPPQTT